MSLTSPLGDLPITDPQAMRALAHPVRLAALSFLQRNGPTTATQLAPHVGASPSVTSWHLRHLASFGLVLDADPDEVPDDRRQRWWKAAARGFRLEPTEDNMDAMEVLADEMAATADRQAAEWRAHTAPRLEFAWQRLAGLSNTVVRLTPDELESLQDGVVELLARYATRAEEDVPAEARPVRFLQRYLPEAAAE